MLKDFTKENLLEMANDENVDFSVNQVDATLEKMEQWDAKQWALFEHCGRDFDCIDEITDLDIDTDEINFNGEDLLVLDDDEADAREDEELDSYIDECLEIPENLRFYFDDEKWKRDARLDGRGHIISRYDGCENEYCIEFDDDSKVWIFIYRM